MNIREQIIESLQNKTIESKTKINFEKDLANENKSNIKQNFENINAYEGIEYTYL